MEETKRLLLDLLSLSFDSTDEQIINKLFSLNDSGIRDLYKVFWKGSDKAFTKKVGLRGVDFSRWKSGRRFGLYGIGYRTRIISYLMSIISENHRENEGLIDERRELLLEERQVKILRTT